MSEVQQIKTQLIAAAVNAAAAVFQGEAPVPLDATFQDPVLRARALLIYEEAKIQYAAYVAALEDKTGIWRDPVLPVPQVVKTPMGSVLLPGQDVGANLAAVAKVAAGVVSVIPGAAPAVPIVNAVSNALNAPVA